MPSRIDVLLVVLVLIWGANFSVVKQAFSEIAPMPFNVARFVLASAAFLTGIAIVRRRAGGERRVDPMLYTPAKPSAREWRTIVMLGIFGHCAYHLLWAAGLALTTASNSALIMSVSPVAVSTVTAIAGRERIRALHWAGILVSLAGIGVVVGPGISLSGSTARGDMLTLMSVACWTFLTVVGGRLMTRHSPLYISGMTTVIGTTAYLVLAWPTLGAVPWMSLGANVWIAIAFSGLLSVALATMIWYAAVQHIGAARTSAFSNLIPLAALAFAATLAGEPLTMSKIVGAALVLGGIALTRLARPAPAMPQDE